MDTEVQAISTAINELVAKVDATLAEEPIMVTQLIGRLKHISVVEWGLTVFILATLAVAAFPLLIGNLDRISNRFNSYFGRAAVRLTKQESSVLRQKLLKQMKTDVALRLKDSLHILAKIDLEKEEQLHQVGRRAGESVADEPKRTKPFTNLMSRGLAIFRNSGDIKPVRPVEETYSIFYRSDIEGRLLILGEPGAGKTTELLTTAQRLVTEATDNNNKPIPIILELSSWVPSTPIFEWMGQQLQQTYGVSKRLAKPLVCQWIEQAQILLLLDGLDELGHTHQLACIEMLDNFLTQYSDLSVIVCCRREEYEQGGQQLRQLKGAIYLQALSSGQIQRCLKDLELRQLWDNIKAQPDLLALAHSPLFLTMLVVAYKGQPIQNRRTVFDTYIRTRLHENKHRGTYGLRKGKILKQTRQYLIWIRWLAYQMEERHETEFLIENLQPDWLMSRRQRWMCRLFEGLLGGLLGGLFGGLIFVGVFSFSPCLSGHV